jgi:hypothetical protein
VALSVIGAGFGRTGTLSLKFALERLGFDRCYHMKEVIENPSAAAHWSRAAEGEAVDWEEVFAGYRATVDWPACAFYRELADRYPEAKVILTWRDPERWYRSASQTIFQALQLPLPRGGMTLEQARMARRVLFEQSFGGRIDDRDHVIAVFTRHAEEVKRTIPPERLLVYEVAEGWEPLCRFLEVPMPDEPFPQVNSTDEFRQIFFPAQA